MDYIFFPCVVLSIAVYILNLGQAVAPAAAPFRCYECQGIDLPECLGGSHPTKICQKGVQSCYVTYRKVGATNQVARGCRDAGSTAKAGREAVCSKSSLFGLLTILCSCSTSLCNGNSTEDLQGIQDPLFVEWRR